MPPIANQRPHPKNRVSSAIVTFAFLQIESALWVALVFLLIFFYPHPFLWWDWWFWAVLGVIGETCLIMATIWDQSSAQYIQAKRFRESFCPRRIKQPDYRRWVEQALADYYRTRTESFQATTEHQDNVIYDHWAAFLAAVFQLAMLLDRYRRDALLKRQQRHIPLALQHARARLKLEQDGQNRAQLEQSIRSGQGRLQQLQDLADLVSHAERVLQDSVTGLGPSCERLSDMGAPGDAPQATQTSNQLDARTKLVQDMIEPLQEMYHKVLT